MLTIIYTWIIINGRFTRSTRAFLNIFARGEVWWLQCQGRKLLGSIPRPGKKKLKKKIIIFGWLLWNLWDLPLSMFLTSLLINLAINKHGYVVLICILLRPQKSLSTFIRFVQVPVTVARKQEDVGFCLSIHRCPKVHISKGEFKNIKNIWKFDCTCVINTNTVCWRKYGQNWQSFKKSHLNYLQDVWSLFKRIQIIVFKFNLKEKSYYNFCIFYFNLWIFRPLILIVNK